MTDGTHRWACRDAERLHSRVLHLVTLGQSPNSAQVAYLRRVTMCLLLDEDADLPDGWPEDLRRLLEILERYAALSDEEEAAG